MLNRCRICDKEYSKLEVIGVLEDQLCSECEEAVLDTLAEWEEDVSSEEN